MPLNYRTARETDLEPVFALYMDESANPFLTFDPMTLSEFSPIYRSMRDEKNIFVVQLDQEIIATFRLLRKSHRQSHIFYLGGFAIKDSFKGKGYGKEVLEHIKTLAKNQSIKRIELTVDTENTPAINLYRKVGFEIEGKLKNNYRLSSTGKYYDEYIMALLIE
jgi:RimJ/RimL family protein N-acetyltransferase